MAKKNKSKSSKNGTATAPTEARQSGQGRSTIIAAAAIAALAAVAAVVMSRDPAAAHGQAALRCYASDACAARDLPACGVVTAPSKIAAALRCAVDAKTVAVAAVSTLDTTLVRKGRDTLLSTGANASAIDRALLALDVECGTKAAAASPSIRAVLDIFKEVSAAHAREPVGGERIGQLRKALQGHDIDVRGALGGGGLFASALSVATADTPLLRAARNCDARATMALLQLGANPRLSDARHFRALDLALKCEDRRVFGVAKVIVDFCGKGCVDFEGDITPRDGLNPLHRVLLLWASSFFPTRPQQNPWNMMLGWMLEAGADATQQTRTPSGEAPLHIACAKRNVKALELILDALERAGALRPALQQGDALGGFLPLHVCGGAWQIWSVTLPRLLAGAGELHTQALDADDACIPPIRALATPDGHPALATADTLAKCGFLGRAVALLLEKGADIAQRDAQNRTVLHFLHPHLIQDAASSLMQVDAPYANVITAAVLRRPDALQLLAESRLERERWHVAPRKPAPHSSFDAPSLDCDAVVALATSDDIVREHIRNHRPVLRRNALDESWNNARRDWGDREALAKLAGGALVRSGPIPYASAFSTTEAILSLKEAMHRGYEDSVRAAALRKNKLPVDAPSYVFEQIRWDGSSADHPLFDVIKERVGSSPLDAYVIHNAQFFVGSKYSGAPAHYHSHAMNFLVTGKKRWLLWPPASALYSRTPAVSWLDRKDAQAYQCVQPANASLYVPAGWGHAVLNLDDHTLGVALEFHVPGELAWSFESRAVDLVAASRRL